MRRHAALALGLTSMLVLAACATERQSSGSDGGSVRGVTDDSITVGGLLFKTTTFGISNADEELGAQAAFMAANDAGGVHGRMIDYIGAKDDNGDPAKNTAAARELVDRDEVFAVVPATSFALAGASYLEQNQVPYVGYGYAAAYCGSEWGFGFNGCVTPEPGPDATAGAGLFVVLGDAIGGAEGKTIAFVQPDTPDQRKIAGIAQAEAEGVGFEVVYNETNVPQAPPSDWTPYVQAVLTSNDGGPPDVVASYLSTNATVGLFPALRAAGYAGPVLDLISYGPTLVEDPTLNAAFQEAYLGIPVQPAEAGTPEVEEMLQWLREAAGDEDLQYTLEMGVGYASAQVFLGILEAAGEDLTPESFQEAASDITIEDSVGGPVSFPEAKTGTTGCYSLVQLVGNEYEVQGEMTCEPVVTYTG